MRQQTTEKIFATIIQYVDSWEPFSCGEQTVGRNTIFPCTPKVQTVAEKFAADLVNVYTGEIRPSYVCDQ